MNGAGRHSLDEAGCDPHRFDGCVVREHRDHDFGIERLFRTSHDAGAGRLHRLRGGRRSVPHDKRVPLFEQTRRHALTHLTEADKSDFHFDVSVLRSVR